MELMLMGLTSIIDLLVLIFLIDLVLIRKENYKSWIIFLISALYLFIVYFMKEYAVLTIFPISLIFILTNYKGKVKRLAYNSFFGSLVIVFISLFLNDLILNLFPEAIAQNYEAFIFIIFFKLLLYLGVALSLFFINKFYENKEEDFKTIKIINMRQFVYIRFFFVYSIIMSLYSLFKIKYNSSEFSILSIIRIEVFIIILIMGFAASIMFGMKNKKVYKKDKFIGDTKKIIYDMDFAIYFLILLGITFAVGNDNVSFFGITKSSIYSLIILLIFYIGTFVKIINFYKKEKNTNLRKAFNRYVLILSMYSLFLLINIVIKFII